MKKSRFLSVLLGFLFLTGLSLLLYPTVSDYWNLLHQARAIAIYADKVAELEEKDYTEILDQARKYNERLGSMQNHYSEKEGEELQYDSILDISDDGMMGYIEIPSIKCYLPIYHGTEEEILQAAIGHIKGSSVPVGGKGTHTVLSGHRGLPSAKLFSDLDKLKDGDLFMLRVVNETMTYQVDQILIVEPDQTESLAIDPKKDYCTLITCTPYGINSHRLLVRGHRVENQDAADDVFVTADILRIDPMIIVSIVISLMFIAGFVWIMVDRNRRRKKRK